MLSPTQQRRSLPSLLYKSFLNAHWVGAATLDSTTCGVAGSRVKGKYSVYVPIFLMDRRAKSLKATAVLPPSFYHQSDCSISINILVPSTPQSFLLPPPSHYLSPYIFPPLPLSLYIYIPHCLSPYIFPHCLSPYIFPPLPLSLYISPTASIPWYSPPPWTLSTCMYSECCPHRIFSPLPFFPASRYRFFTFFLVCCVK